MSLTSEIRKISDALDRITKKEESNRKELQKTHANGTKPVTIGVLIDREYCVLISKT